MSDAAVTLTETETSVLVAHLFSQWLLCAACRKRKQTWERGGREDAA